YLKLVNNLDMLCHRLFGHCRAGSGPLSFWPMGQRSASYGMNSIPLKRRSDLHIARKLWHMFGVLLVATCHHFLSTDQALRAMALGAFIFVTTDVLRHQWPPLNAWALRIFGPFMREHERNGLAGTTYLVLGTFLIIW